MISAEPALDLRWELVSGVVTSLGVQQRARPDKGHRDHLSGVHRN